jgi:hypothetical protein
MVIRCEHTHILLQQALLGVVLVLAVCVSNIVERRELVQ